MRKNTDFITINYEIMIQRFTSKFLTLFLAIFLSATLVYAQPDGENLFKVNCAQCHVTGDNVVIGPGLKDILKRRNEAWLIPWIRNSQAMIKSGDAYAVKLFEQYNKTVMPTFPLKDDEIKAILAYVKAEGEKAPATVAPPTAGGVAATAEDEGFPWGLLIITALLIVIYLALDRAKKALDKVARQRDGTPEPVELHGKVHYKSWIRSHKKFIILFFIIGAAWSSYAGWYALAGIGISQDYQPDQPIKFSHQLHAGTNGINCKYCHNSAEKGKSAGIPSLNVCMNCHKYVQSGPQYGKEEISKIYAALDYDPATQKYGNKPKPIQWIQIHNLPDFAYFNHSQHVKVGGIECQTCHGAVEEMEVVKQYSPLTMGWCINCHRVTEVKMAGNGYYTQYHEELKKKYGADAKITVEKIGGLECARCHY